MLAPVLFVTAKQEEDNGGEKWVRRPFPKHSLEQSLVVPSTIQDKNAGRPMRRLLLADAVGRKPTSSEFKYLLSSSYKYGLTDGTEKSDQISLTPLGQVIVKPRSQGEKMSKLQESALKPDLFKRVYEYYNNAKFPTDGVFFKNVLERDFGVPDEWTDDCMKILNENGRFAGIIRSVSGSPMVILGDLSQAETAGAETQGAEIPKMETPGEMTGQVPSQTGVPPQIPKQVFVAHGKNKKPLEQLEKALTRFKVPYKVAVEEPHSGRPVGQKVAELMKQCTSGVFIFTADEETTGQQGEKTLRPSDNVVYELGAASVLYGNKIVIFKEEGVTFASDFGDIGYIPFEKDRLDAKAADLMVELISLGFLQLTPT
jgi:predicted nucleotide-binding protein